MNADVDAVAQHHIEEMVDTLVAEFGDRFERAQSVQAEVVPADRVAVPAT